MKVGILTFYYKNDNFGGQLQARALVRAIENCSVWEAEQIQYDYLRSWSKLPYFLRFVKSVQQSFQGGFKNGLNFFITRLKVQKKMNENIELTHRLADQLNNRKLAFHTFFEETPHSEEVFDSSSIKNSLDSYDCFICGGDQIWNDWNDWFLHNALDDFCLSFVPQEVQKFSYAPSVPLKKIRPVFINRLKNNIQQLDAISVRENSSVLFLKDGIDKKIVTVADPVLLLNKDQWDHETKPVKVHKKYIFCYLLGEGENNRNAVQSYARNIERYLITVPHIVNVNKQDENFGDFQDFTSGPAEFLTLIKNADVVVTDSYHASVFSMIYHKPFYVLERTTKLSGGSMGNRLTDFLREYKLESQGITTELLEKSNIIPKIDYKESDRIWEYRRLESYEYLKKNLKKK